MNFLVLLSIVSKLCVCVCAQQIGASLAELLIFKVCLAVREDSWYQSEELCKLLTLSLNCYLLTHAGRRRWEGGRWESAKLIRNTLFFAPEK